MQSPLRTLLITLCLLCGSLAPYAGRGAADDEGTSEREPVALRVLLIGNSYSRFNDLPDLLEAFAASVPDGPEVTVDMAFKAGASLETHWKRGMARRMLRRHAYTHVVLQDHSRAVFDGPATFLKYAERFEREADAIGARTVLFTTWARHPSSELYQLGKDARTPLEMQSRIDALYDEAAMRLGADVAHVGDAWLLVMARWPRLRLHRPDASHPTRLGTYLTGCVLYGALTGRSPQGIRHGMPGAAPQHLQRLRGVADEVLRTPSPPGPLANTGDGFLDNIGKEHSNSPPP